jgi:hypothetical protein
MDAAEARGPVYARAQQIKAISPQDDYCMQIDAHTDAVQDWDVKIVRFHTCAAFLPLLSGVDEGVELPSVCSASECFRVRGVYRACTARLEDSGDTLTVRDSPAMSR